MATEPLEGCPSRCLRFAGLDTFAGVVAATSNFAIQANFNVMGVCLLFMRQAVREDTLSNGTVVQTHVYAPSVEHVSWLASAVFAGAVVGQLVMGYAGDVFGYERAMLLCNFLTVAGAVGSALLPPDDGPADTIFTIIIICRVVLGVGVGGKYPLSAVMASSSASAGQHAATVTAKSFFWQMPGAVSPYVLACCLYLGFSGRCGGKQCTDPATVSLQFRLLLGFGAVPAMIALVGTWVLLRRKREKEKAAEKEAAEAGPPVVASRFESPLVVAMRHPELWVKLVGTGGCWLLFDMICYGNQIFQPQILENIFGPSLSILDNCLQNLAVTAITVPGVLSAIACLKPMGSKVLQNWGFVAIASMCLALAFLFNGAGTAPHHHHGAASSSSSSHSVSHPWVTFAAFCLALCAMSWGVNVTTFVLPGETYPPELRSTFNGLSAACAKVGALLGAFFFQPISDAYGISVTYYICAVIGLLGVLLTHLFIQPSRKSGGPGYCRREWGCVCWSVALRSQQTDLSTSDVGQHDRATDALIGTREPPSYS